MSRTSMRALAVAGLLALPLHLARAQPEPTPDASLLSRADSITVGDYCRIARRVLADTAVVRALGADSSDVRTNGAVLCDPLLSSFTLRALAGRAPAPLAAVARVRTDGNADARRRLFEAMAAFRAAVRAPEMRDVVRAALGAEHAELVRVAETAQSLLTMAARDRALARLVRYERKLGPTSAKLNGPEVLLNYVAQRWIPGFRATPLGGPSPWEVVASYAPGYLTSVDGSVVPVSVSEFGLRRYLFGERFGKTGIRGVLFPSYWSAGMATASDRNGALVWPWEGRNRSGGYVSWGAIKVGYLPGRAGEVIVSKQFQAVPFLF